SLRSPPPCRCSISCFRVRASSGVRSPRPTFRRRKELPMRRWSSLCLAILLACLLGPSEGRAFCGFFVAKGDAKLFNHSSQVVIVRDQDRTVMTMVNDYKGDPKEFAIVVPVPKFLERDQIHVGDQAVVEHLDAY